MLHLTVVTDGGVEKPYFKWINTMISNVKNSMHGTHHAINQKHLPRIQQSFVLSLIDALI